MDNFLPLGFSSAVTALSDPRQPGVDQPPGAVQVLASPRELRAQAQSRGQGAGWVQPAGSSAPCCRHAAGCNWRGRAQERARQCLPQSTARSSM